MSTKSPRRPWQSSMIVPTYSVGTMMLAVDVRLLDALDDAVASGISAGLRTAVIVAVR